VIWGALAGLYRSVDRFTLWFFALMSVLNFALFCLGTYRNHLARKLHELAGTPEGEGQP